MNAQSPQQEAPRTGWFSGWADFWFSAIPAGNFHFVRILVGVLVLGWLTTFVGNESAYFGLSGWFDLQAYKEAVENPEGIPMPLTWSILYSIGHNPTLVTAFYWTAWACALLFTLGVAVRLTAVLTWVCVASFVFNPVVDFGGDHLVLILTMYMMVGYLLYGQSREGIGWKDRILGPWDASVFSTPSSAVVQERPPSFSANVALRLVQIHFAIVIVMSGLHKLQFGDWWSGWALYFPLNPPFETTDAQLRDWANNSRQNMFFVSLATYIWLAWQLAFPLFAWRRSCRWLLLGGVAIGWIGCVWLYQTPIYGPAYCVAAFAFVGGDEWKAWGRWLRGLLGGEEAVPKRGKADRTRAKSELVKS